MDTSGLIKLSHATYVGPSGATAAATYSFMTSGYQPPTPERYIESDLVKNQNGIFKYVYDNGPGFGKFAPFEVRCEDSFATYLSATAGAQYSRLKEMWNHPGVLILEAPEGVYTVNWGKELERAFRTFPRQTGDKIEYSVTVQFEEAQ